MVLTRFHNRSQYEFHLAVLRALEEKGPAPITVLAYRGEMNDSQVQEVLTFLEARNMIIKTPIDHDARVRLAIPYSLSTKHLVSITKAGQKYLDMLLTLENQIDWTRRASEIVKRRHR